MTAQIPQAREDELVAQIKAHIAFEHMLVSVLIGAGVSAAALFVVNNAVSLAKGGWSLAIFLATGLDAVWFAFVVFLVGFGAVVAVGVPLFLALEKVPYRRLWPYILAAVILQYAAHALIFGPPPLFEKPATFLIFAPGLLMAGLFWRRIQPLWRAGKMENEAPKPPLRIVH
ncbi:MAG: hypothetical protein RIC52_00015 [Amphiplicatus sp.]